MADTTLPEDFTILALETSCDETAAAVVRGGRTVVSNVVASQIDEHRRYGGIVPEVASRQHILALEAVVSQALAPLPGGWADVHAVAATYGPGLAGALMTGLNAAKAMAWMRDLPFVGVNHIEAHIYANWLISDERRTTSDERRATNDERRTMSDERRTMSDERRATSGERRAGDTSAGADALVVGRSSAVAPPQFPLVALVVSGGHTLLALLEGHGCYRLLGQTRDDAAGEAFDKAARIMGLGFPGGPAIQQAAERAPGGVTLPRAWLRDSYDFSFSGLKTAVLHQVQERQQREAKVTPKNAERKAHSPERRAASAEPAAPAQSSALSPQSSDRFVAQLAYAFQESVVDVLVTKAVDAARAFGATEILLAGGVAA
ncbi:MAG TPA: tRNA (adenosine(37)-N6)-threonylcarbamoyltransferase complex transferase subunit TsaD, partial [Roseiflexaceae bacterium]|nr:tRNA (adenosine(37)-N6)-threonylcarbamoyltransferase complex transferase subunit TsaD [Roseiflexaceae bacterium]